MDDVDSSRLDLDHPSVGPVNDPPLVVKVSFGTRRWVFVLCGVLGGVLAMVIVVPWVAWHAESMPESHWLGWLGAGFVGSLLSAPLAMRWSSTIWSRFIVRELNAALSQADATRAERAIRALTRITPHTAEGTALVSMLRFRMWCSLEDWSAARRWFGDFDMEKLRESPDAPIVALVALTLLQTGDTDAASRLLEPTLSRTGDDGPKSAAARAVHGMVLARRGRHGEAIEQLAGALANRPIVVGRQAVFALAESLLAEGRHQEARAILTPIAQGAANTRLGRRAAEHLARSDNAFR